MIITWKWCPIDQENIYQNLFLAIGFISNGFNINVILPSIDEMVEDKDCLRRSWYPKLKLIIVHSRIIYLDKQNFIKITDREN